MIQDRDDIFMSWVPKDRDINTLEGFESWRQTISDQEYENIQENCDNLSEQNYDFRIETLESIPIKSIELDKVMINTLVKLNPKIILDDYTLNFKIPVVGKVLQRMESMFDARDDEIKLPPIKVRSYVIPEKHIYIPINSRKSADKKFNVIPEKKVYNIIDGRHRVVTAILYGDTNIDAIVKK